MRTGENVTALHETEILLFNVLFTILLTHGLARWTSMHSLRKAEYRGAVFDSKVRCIDPFCQSVVLLLTNGVKLVGIDSLVP